MNEQEPQMVIRDDYHARVEKIGAAFGGIVIIGSWAAVIEGFTPWQYAALLTLASSGPIAQCAEVLYKQSHD